MLRTIMHIDMDAFYASVEVRDNPSLKGLPVIVGGNATSRGVVAAASYEARKFGIHSAMPTKAALKLCPEVVMLPPNLAKYVEASKQIRAIFARYTPLIEPLSLDEAFLDLSDSLKLFGSAETIGKRIRQEIADEVHLPCSVGIATCKFIAKIASDIGKPQGFVVVHESEVQAFLDPLPVGRIWGVGRQTQKIFDRHGIKTIHELRMRSLDELQTLFGNQAEHFYKLVRGQDERQVIPGHDPKSVSHETTFAQDISDHDELRAQLLTLTEKVMQRLRKHKLKGRCIHVRIRFADFSTITRSKTLGHATDTTREAWQATSALFEAHWPKGTPVRLIGMGIGDLSGKEASQGELFEPAAEYKSFDVDHTLDAIKERFGKESIHFGKTGKH